MAFSSHEKPIVYFDISDFRSDKCQCSTCIAIRPKQEGKHLSIDLADYANLFNPGFGFKNSNISLKLENISDQEIDAYYIKN